MAILLPLFSFVVFAYIFSRRVDLRFACICSATAVGAFVVLSTESLSVARALTRAGVSIAWAVLAVMALFITRIQPSSRAVQVPTLTQVRAWTRTRRLESWLVVAALSLAFLVFLTAVISPPNTWDALDYHLPRMVMWIQNGTVDLFPTVDYSRLISPPWAEYSMLHLDLLWGGDRFVNLVQCGCFFGGAVGASVLAKDFGAGSLGQIAAAFFAMSVPQGVLEASGALNSCCAAFWVVASAVFMLRFTISPSTPCAIGAASAVGLALMTKGTCHIFLPLLLLSLWLAGTPATRWALVRRLPLLMLVVVALNAGHGVREYRFTGSPLGLPFPAAGPHLHFMDDRISISGTFSTFLRNLSLHAVTPIGHINRVIEGGVKTLIRLVGEEPDDSANTWLETRFFEGYQMPPTGLLRHEAFAGNPIHLVLIAVAGMFLLRDRQRAISSATKWFACGLAGSFVLFCALIRWQIWGARLELPVFVLGAAVLGVVLAPHLASKAGIASVSVVLLLALNCAARNRLRPLLPSPQSVLTESRSVTYFADGNADNAEPWIAAAARIRESKCDVVGFDEAERHFYDYPLLELVGGDTRERTVRFVGVDNLSSRFVAPTDKPPCAVACLGCTDDARRTERYRSTFGEGVPYGDVLLFGAH